MKMKKILAATLAATMVMASALTVCATTTSGGSGASSTSTSTSTSTPTYAEQATVSADATIKVGGVEVKTSVAGVYGAQKVEGVAIAADLATVTANLGLKAGQTPYVIIYDTDAKKSHRAMDSINAAASALGAEFVTALNVDLGAREKGKFVSLADGTIAMVVGVPSVDETKTYSLVCVQPGGAITILEDQDTNPKTVTFEVKAGLGTYAIVAK